MAKKPVNTRHIEDDTPHFVLVGICHMCVHRTSVFNCRAFPDGIPAVILKGEVEHTRPFPGDRGIIFEKSDVTMKD